MLRWILLAGLLIWIGAMWYVVIYALRRGWGPYVHSKRQAKMRVEARVKAKQGRQEMHPLTWEPEYVQKVLLFECEDGVDRDYEVHDDVYDWVEEGDDGVLVYQGALFVDFEARRPRHDLGKIYKRLTRT